MLVSSSYEMHYSFPTKHAGIVSSRIAKLTGKLVEPFMFL